MRLATSLLRTPLLPRLSAQSQRIPLRTFAHMAPKKSAPPAAAKAQPTGSKAQASAAKPSVLGPSTTSSSGSATSRSSVPAKADAAAASTAPAPSSAEPAYDPAPTKDAELESKLDSVPAPSSSEQDKELLADDRAEQAPHMSAEELARGINKKHGKTEKGEQLPPQEAEKVKKEAKEQVEKGNTALQASKQNGKEKETDKPKVKEPEKPKPKPAEPVAAPPLEFERLSQTIYVHRPVPGAAERKPAPPLEPLLRSPRTVLLFGWMDGSLAQVQRYAAAHASLFPRATIVLCLSRGTGYFASATSRAAVFSPLIKVLREEAAREASLLALREASEDVRVNQESITADVDERARIAREGRDKKSLPPLPAGLVMHSFSDGGASNLAAALKVLGENDIASPRAVVFDSSPGRTSASSGSKAFTMVLAKRPLLRYIVRSALWVVLATVLLIKRVLRIRTWSDSVRDALNSPRRWSSSSSSSGPKLPPRLYLYSRADELIAWPAVEEHARAAAKVLHAPPPKPLLMDQQKEGEVKLPPGNVVLARFEKAPHVAMGKFEEKKYWQAVRLFLERTL